MKISIPLLVLVLCVLSSSAFEYTVEYAIGKAKPTEYKKRGVISCDATNTCKMTNEKDLEFKGKVC